MTVRILWLEDDPNDYRRFVGRLTGDLRIPANNIEWVRSREEAVNRILYGEPFSHALLDLHIEGDEAGHDAGLEVLKLIRERGVHCTIILLSNFEEETAKVRKDLRAHGIKADQLVNKAHHQHFVELVKPLLKNVGDVVERLRARGLLFVSNDRTVTLVREINSYVEELRTDLEGRLRAEKEGRDRPPKSPLPSVLLSGPLGSGKSQLAEAIGHLMGCPPTRCEKLNMASPSDAGDNASIQLFGARKYQGGDFQGIFERATHYADLKPGVCAKPTSRAGWNKPGVVFLDEIHGLPDGAHDRLHDVMDDSRVQTLGAQLSIPVACVLVAATHWVGEEFEAERRRAPAFYNRFCRTFEVPPLSERGEEWRHILTHLAARRFEVQPEGVIISRGVSDRLQENVSSGVFNTRDIAKIARALRAPVVTEKDVDDAEANPSARVASPCPLHTTDRVKALLPVSMPPSASAAPSPGLCQVLDLEWREADVCGLSEAMLKELEKRPKAPRLTFGDWLECHENLFGEPTRRRRAGDAQTWGDACLRLVLELRESRLSGWFYTTQDVHGKQVRDWKWVEFVNPTVNGVRRPPKGKKPGSFLADAFGFYPRKGFKGGLERLAEELRELSSRESPRDEDDPKSWQLARRLYPEQ